MDITAIIAEYNPLHNGHLLHIQKTKEAFPESRIVCIMSGPFTQRGEPAVATERERAVWAIKAGADAVVRMPLYSSFSDGESFALAGVRAAQRIGAQRLSFGSECGDVSRIIEVAKILSSPTEEYKALFDLKMSRGMTYPRAISESLDELYPDKGYSEILSNPNDILAVLYTKSLLTTDIEPFCIKREDNGYYSAEPVKNLLSASAIRELMLNSKESAKPYLPGFVYDTLNMSASVESAFSSAVLYKLRTMSADELAKIQDVTEGLENRLKRASSTALDIPALLSAVKTKRYTMSRLRRILLYALFDVTKQKFNEAKQADYLRLLAIKRTDTELLSALSACKVSKAYSELDEKSRTAWLEENKMSDVHELLLQKTDIRNAVFL